MKRFHANNTLVETSHESLQDEKISSPLEPDEVMMGK
jgi:hypothetical protein